MIRQIAENINILGDFCGIRDIPELIQQNIKIQYGFEQADILILFGGSIPEGCDVAANAFLSNVAKRLMIVGGEGHTTKALRQHIHKKCPAIMTAGKMEADIMQEYITMHYGITDILLECKSTNCGNNITNALKVLQENHIDAKNIIIMQDATMQRRMYAGFKKYAPNINIINYASYRNEVIVIDNKMDFKEQNLWGMWNLDHYITLLMGEIPRLMNNKDGYGPNGQNYIASVDIPQNVKDAFSSLNRIYSDKIRIANPEYASKT